MNRRTFLRGVLAVAAEPAVRRAYSFIWAPPEPRVEVVPASALNNPWMLYERALGPAMIVQGYLWHVVVQR